MFIIYLFCMVHFGGVNSQFVAPEYAYLPKLLSALGRYTRVPVFLSIYYIVGLTGEVNICRNYQCEYNHG